MTCRQLQTRGCVITLVVRCVIYLGLRHLFSCASPCAYRPAGVGLALVVGLSGGSILVPMKLGALGLSFCLSLRFCCRVQTLRKQLLSLLLPFPNEAGHVKTLRKQLRSLLLPFPDEARRVGAHSASNCFRFCCRSKVHVGDRLSAFGTHRLSLRSCCRSTKDSCILSAVLTWTIFQQGGPAHLGPLSFRSPRRVLRSGLRPVLRLRGRHRRPHRHVRAHPATTFMDYLLTKMGRITSGGG